MSLPFPLPQETKSLNLVPVIKNLSNTLPVQIKKVQQTLKLFTAALGCHLSGPLKFKQIWSSGCKQISVSQQRKEKK